MSRSKTCLKIIVDKKANKVVFAEADNKFVDLICNMLTLPLATVAKLLKAEDMIGCLASAYKSVDSLDAKYFHASSYKRSVLTPKIAPVPPFLGLDRDKVVIFKCPDHDQVSLQEGIDCGEWFCHRKMNDTSLSYVNPERRFVKEAVAYMVMDDLEMQPLSTSLIMDRVKDNKNLEEKVVEVGVKEGLAILKASLETKAVLSTVFLGKDAEY